VTRGAAARAVTFAAILSMGLAACQRAPQRVTSGDGRCSVMMPDPPKYAEGTAMITGVALKEQSWGVTPDDLSTIARPTDITAYVLRRATAPNGTMSVGPRMLEDAGRRLALTLQNQGYEPPIVRTITLAAGPAVEVRSSLRGATSLVAARFVAVPNGYCEVTIIGATTEQAVSAYFDSMSIRP
jgi:hypothetical protein